MKIAVDFDGTVVEHRYPEIGLEVPYAQDVLKMLVKAGHQLILLTMRSGEYLDQAVAWFKDRDIELWAVNDNPEQVEWTESRKVYAHLYIDDAALGCPLNFDHQIWRPDGDPVMDRPVVDWPKVYDLLHEMMLIPDVQSDFRIASKAPDPLRGILMK